jgi:hypothetical protein
MTVSVRLGWPGRCSAATRPQGAALHPDDALVP